MQIHWENTSKCFHVHHLGFVLVISVSTTPVLEDPETIIFYTAAPMATIRIADPRVAQYNNKYIFIETRLENKQLKKRSRTKLHFFNTLHGKYTSVYSQSTSLDHKARSNPGINLKYLSKRPKYQPINVEWHDKEV